MSLTFQIVKRNHGLGQHPTASVTRNSGSLHSSGNSRGCYKVAMLYMYSTDRKGISAVTYITALFVQFNEQNGTFYTDIRGDYC
jgi:hypothetical protein